MKFQYSVVIVLLFPAIIWSQSDSYQYKIEKDNGYGRVPIIANENNDISIVLRSAQLKHPQAVLQFPGTDSVCEGYSYAYPPAVVDNFLTYNTSDVAGRGNWVYITGAAKGLIHLTALNLSSGEYWCKQFFPSTLQYKFPNFSLADNGDLLVVNGVVNSGNPPHPFYPILGILELFRLDSMGNTIWKKGLWLKDSAQGNSLTVLPQGISTDNANNIYITGLVSQNNPAAGAFSYQILMKLDSQGNPIAWKKINDMAFGISVFTDDAIYLLDNRQSDVSFFPPNEESAIIAKFDHDLNLLWLKKYTAENFPYLQANITATNNGGLYLSSATTGVYPVILAELDTDGNILSQKGYAHYFPYTVVLEDGSLVIASNWSVDSLGNPSNIPIIAKTDTEGNIAGCVTLPTCLEVRDTTVSFGTFHVETHPVLDIEDLPLVIEPVSYTLTPFCDYPPAPVPTFTFPDTLCTGASAASTSDNNRLAQAREWHLTGMGVDSLLRDSLEFIYEFTVPGQYTLRQSVWVLGCRTDYERSITVLPPLTLSIVADSLVCPDEQVSISVEANRSASFSWNNGQIGSHPFVTGSGIYAVTATDGHCSEADSTSITVVAALLNGAPPFILPQDTTTCQPYDLVPQSQFTDLYFTDGHPTPRPSIRLEAAGSYRIGMTAFGCEFWETYNYGVDCHVNVYLPNAFSPNGDGINDIFEPFGTDFNVLELFIYDRWGGLLNKGLEWDGGKAGQGIYMYVLTYLNLRSGLEEEVRGQVLLLK